MQQYCFYSLPIHFILILSFVLSLPQTCVAKVLKMEGKRNLSKPHQVSSVQFFMPTTQGNLATKNVSLKRTYQMVLIEYDRKMSSQLWKQNLVWACVLAALLLNFTEMWHGQLRGCTGSRSDSVQVLTFKECNNTAVTAGIHLVQLKNIQTSKSAISNLYSFIS